MTWPELRATLQFLSKMENVKDFLVNSMKGRNPDELLQILCDIFAQFDAHSKPVDLCPLVQYQNSAPDDPSEILSCLIPSVEALGAGKPALMSTLSQGSKKSEKQFILDFKVKPSGAIEDSIIETFAKEKANFKEAAEWLLFQTPWTAPSDLQHHQALDLRQFGAGLYTLVSYMACDSNTIFLYTCDDQEWTQQNFSVAHSLSPLTVFMFTISVFSVSIYLMDRTKECGYSELHKGKFTLPQFEAALNDLLRKHRAVKPFYVVGDGLETSLEEIDLSETDTIKVYLAKSLEELEDSAKQKEPKSEQKQQESSSTVNTKKPVTEAKPSTTEKLRPATPKETRQSSAEIEKSSTVKTKKPVTEAKPSTTEKLRPATPKETRQSSAPIEITVISYRTDKPKKHSLPGNMSLENAFKYLQTDLKTTTLSGWYTEVGDYSLQLPKSKTITLSDYVARFGKTIWITTRNCAPKKPEAKVRVRVISDEKFSYSTISVPITAFMEASEVVKFVMDSVKTKPKRTTPTFFYFSDDNEVIPCDLSKFPESYSEVFLQFTTSISRRVFFGHDRGAKVSFKGGCYFDVDPKSTFDECAKSLQKYLSISKPPTIYIYEGDNIAEPSRSSKPVGKAETLVACIDKRDLEKLLGKR